MDLAYGAVNAGVSMAGCQAAGVLVTGLWSAMGVGAAGIIITFIIAAVLARNTREDAPGPAEGNTRRAWLAAIAAAVLGFVAWGVSLRIDPPYSTGQGLGLPILLGSAAGIVAILLVSRLEYYVIRTNSTRIKYLAGECMAFLALLTLALSIKLFGKAPQEAFIGTLVGTMFAAVPYYYLKRVCSHSADWLMETYAALIALVGGGYLLAVLHFDETVLRDMWAIPILLFGTVCVASLVATEICTIGNLKNRPYFSSGLSMVLSSAVTVIVAVVLSNSFMESLELFWVSLFGVLAGMVIMWIASTVDSGGFRFSGADTASAAALLALALAVGTFKVWNGLGIALGFTAYVAVLLPVMGLGSKTAIAPKAVFGSLAFGIGFVLFRIFMENYRIELATIDLRIHYTFVGAVLGVLVPLILSASLAKMQKSEEESVSAGRDIGVLIGLGIISLMVVAAPLVLCVVWGIKASLGLAFGLVVGLAIQMHAKIRHAPETEMRPAPKHISATLFVILAFLVCIQFTRLVIDIEATRDARAWVIGITAAAGVLWLAVSALLAPRKKPEEA